MSFTDFTPTVSVVIVSWNAKDYLRQCLDTLTIDACKYPMEIIVVDNASSDGSPEMVREIFPEVRLIESGANLGFGKANNIGIRASKGRYLALINSDVKVLQNCITGLVDYCDAHPKVGMAGPYILGRDAKLQRSCRGFPSVWNMFCRAVALDSMFSSFSFFNGYSLSHWAHDTIRDVNILSGCFWLIRRDALDQVGLLDEAFFMYGEDMDWCRRFCNGGWTLTFVPSSQAIHYGGASSANSPVRFFIEMHRADLQYWRKHHSWAGYATFRSIDILSLTLRIVGYAVALPLGNERRSTFRQKIKRSAACLRWLITGRMPSR